MSQISEIRPNLHLGSLLSLRNVQTLRITHVLSVMKGAPLVKEMHPNCDCEQLRLDVDDEAHVDLLSNFPEALAFMSTALSSANGRLLVHCVAGVSRSPTVVAAYLMKKEDLDAATALASLVRLRCSVQPNDGFREQLNVWEEMGCALQEKHPYFKRRALQEMSEKQLAGEHVSKDELAAPKDLSAAETVLYRCRKCRSLIASTENVTEPPSMSRASSTCDVPSFRGKRTGHQGTNGVPDASQLFVEPMQWMSEVLEGQLQGKLYCPGCKAKLGAFNWAGMQDNKGAWITPAFELQLGRLDAILPAMNDRRVHRPTLL